MLRNDQGDWIDGFARNLGVASAIKAELLGRLEGLMLAWNTSVRRLIVAMDSKSVIHLLQKRVEDCHPLAPLICCYLQMIVKDWLVRLEHTYREGNRVVDQLGDCTNSWLYIF